MSILFAALDQAARSHRAAHGVADTPFPPAFSVRRRQAHMPWWLALIGGIGIGLSSLSLWSDPPASYPVPVMAERTASMPEQASSLRPALQPSPTPLRPDVARPDPAANPGDGEASEPTDYNAPGLSIRTERGTTPMQQIMARAQSAARAGDFAAAIVGYDAVLAREPANREAMSGKAFALQQSGATTEAATIWARLYQNDPNDQAALANMAATLATVDTPDAQDQPARAQAAQPQSATLYAAAAHARIGQGDLDGAQGDLERAWALDRDNPITRLNLAIIADRRGDDAAALALYRQVLADPVAAETLLPMSWTAIEARAAYLAHRGAR